MTKMHDTPRAATRAGSLQINGVIGSRSPDTSSCSRRRMMMSGGSGTGSTTTPRLS